MKDQTYSRSLTRKKVIVLGAETRVGKAAALLAADEGAHVTAIRRKSRAMDKSPIILPFGSLIYDQDLSKKEDYRKLFSDRSMLDHLVYILPDCLSVQLSADLCTASAGKYLMNCFSAVSEAISFAVPLMKSGCSITICSGDEYIVSQEMPNLIEMIKDVLPAYTRIMSSALAPVRLNCVSAGLTTEEFYRHPVKERAQVIKQVSSKLLVGRFGEPEDLALALIYLMKQPFSTGQNLVVDGGMSIRDLNVRHPFLV